MNSEICREYIFEMEEVGIREFWAGINLKDSFLQFVRNGVNGFSTGIFMNEGLSARVRTPFFKRVIWRVERPKSSAPVV